MSLSISPFPLPAWKQNRVIASKVCAALKVLCYFCTELHLFISITISGLPAAALYTGLRSSAAIHSPNDESTSRRTFEIKLNCDKELPVITPIVRSVFTGPRRHLVITPTNTAPPHRSHSWSGETKPKVRTRLKCGPGSLLATIRSLHSITLYSVFPWISAQATAGYWTTSLKLKGNFENWMHSIWRFNDQRIAIQAEESRRPHNIAY